MFILNADRFSERCQVFNYLLTCQRLEDLTASNQNRHLFFQSY